MADPIHVIPLNDLYPHTETGTICPCVPDVKQEGDTQIIVHHAWDEREKYEQNNTIQWFADEHGPYWRGQDARGLTGNYYARGN